jgi:hypothetical protein
MIESVTLDDIRELWGRLSAQPFAMAMVGKTDREIMSFRRDSLVVSG